MVTKKEKFIEILKRFDKPVSIITWTKKIVEQYPSILTQINSNTNEIMTMKELLTGISLKVSKGEFSNIHVVNHGAFRTVQYISDDMKNSLLKKELFKDLEPLLLERKMDEDIKKSTEADRYRLEEFSSIVDQLNRYFSLNFIFHHAKAINDSKKSGRHHIENLEILTSEHAVLKKDGQKRLSIEEQKAYIKRIISIHMMINKTIDLNLTDEVLDMLLDRLEKIY